MFCIVIILHAQSILLNLRGKLWVKFVVQTQLDVRYLQTYFAIE